ncbi:MAG: hypothetical protein FJ403_21705 [Verrucomicrobia bacterium]|nr:hypothetical protein [Verrucomicrobiota bacterium]
MSLRTFILNNFKWKLIALTLAIVVWFVIQFAIWKGVRPTDQPLSNFGGITSFHQPVLVLKAPDDDAIYKIMPAKVEISFRSGANLNKVTSNDIRVFVNLVDAQERENRPIFIHTSYRVQINEVKVEPSTVTVERILQPK